MQTKVPVVTKDFFRISALIRYTLLGLLASLLLPLPFLSVRQEAPIPLGVTLGGITMAFVLLSAALSQRVQTDEEGVKVSYASWVPGFFGKRWQVSWKEITEIQAARTSQGGSVHYLVNQRGDRYLLPMRIAGFARFLRTFEAQTGIDTSTVKPLAQPWMYLTLLVCVVLMLAVDLLIVVASVNPTRHL
jgi:hypothetical protein